jgi:hypothetical protein
VKTGLATSQSTPEPPSTERAQSSEKHALEQRLGHSHERQSSRIVYSLDEFTSGLGVGYGFRDRGRFERDVRPRVAL